MNMKLGCDEGKKLNQKKIKLPCCCGGLMGRKTSEFHNCFIACTYTAMNSQETQRSDVLGSKHIGGIYSNCGSPLYSPCQPV